MAKRRIPEDTADYARWLAREIEGRYTEMRLSPETSLFVGMVLEAYASQLDKAEADGLSMIVTTEDARGHSRVVAAGCHPTVATAAYTSATVVWPKERVLLRHGLRIMCQRPDVKDDPIEDRPK